MKGVVEGEEEVSPRSARAREHVMKPVFRMRPQPKLSLSLNPRFYSAFQGHFG